MIEVQLVGVRIEWPSQTPIVLLKERSGERFLPIWITRDMAEAIEDGRRGIEHERPLSHELMRDLLTGLGVQVDHVAITELRSHDAGGTFFAEIVMSRNGTKVSVSARPSDAIALAVRVECPIFASESVLAEAGIELKGEEQSQTPEPDPEQEVERFRSFLEQVNPEDFKS